MGDQSRSARFQALFKSALQAYEKKTGITLVKHPLAVRLRSCRTAEDITALLQSQAKAFGDSNARGRIVKVIKTTVSILTAISKTGTFADTVGVTLFPPAKAVQAGLAVLLDAEKKALISGGDSDTLVDLLESIEKSVNRLDVYTQIHLTPAIVEIVVKIMVELLSILALVTKELQERKSTELKKKFFGNSDIEAALQRLDRLTQDEVRNTAVQTLGVIYDLSHNMREFMKGDKESIHGIRESLENLRQVVNEMNKLDSDKQQDIFRWLSPPDPSKMYSLAPPADMAARGTDVSPRLHQASNGGRVELAQLFVEHSGEAAARNPNGSTPLRPVPKGRHVELAQLLTEHGANSEAQESNGLRPLDLVCGLVDVEFAQLLVENSAHMAGQDVDGWTPLHWASYRGCVKPALLLMEHGADLEAQDSKGRRPLYRASEGGHVQLAQLLIDHGAAIEAQDPKGYTLLHWVSDWGHEELTRLLIEHDANMAARDASGWTPLHWACYKGRVKPALVLVEHGANLDTQDSDGRTPLHKKPRTQKGTDRCIGCWVDVKFARLLVEHGADVAARDVDGWTPLHWACYRGRVRPALFLIEHGADMDSQDPDGKTPLQKASQEGHVHLGLLLLARGANA